MTVKRTTGTGSKRSAKKKVHFKVKAPTGSKVFVAGSFNNWDPEQHPLEENLVDGLFAATINLPCGRHEYKFIVNGSWVHDPNCPETAPNSCGSMNSVMDL